MAKSMGLAAAVTVGFLLAAECTSAEPKASKEVKKMSTTNAKSFLDEYQKKYAELDIRVNLTYWDAATTGKQEAFDKAGEAVLAERKFHSDADAYKLIQKLRADADNLTPHQARSLKIAELAYQRNQLPADLLKQIVELSTEIEKDIKTYRATVDGKRFSNNKLLELLSEEKDSNRRKKAWEALKQVGGEIAPKIVRLAKLRNKAAEHLGFENYWDMQIRLQEHDPKQLLAIFADLERLTQEPFEQMKAELDGELGRRFSVDPKQMMPWHYDNPFFQAPPPSEKVDLDEFYEDKTKEQIAEISGKFFADVGLPAEGILKRSDLYEREGKDQHAFAMDVDRAGDVRTLCNITPTAEWMGVTLHELGHAVYDEGVDRQLPYNLRGPAHAFTTEGVAMLFGCLMQEPSWMVTYAGADQARVDELAEAIRQQRRRELLIFARWTMVMLHFEKALYENPGRDLNTLWWDYVERFQLVNRPADRDEPDWAAKPHFTIAPVYYHNYMLGELFAAQLRGALAKKSGHEGPTIELKFTGRKDFGEFLTKNVFQPAKTLPWPKFVEKAVGEPLTVKYFAEEIRSEK